MTQPAGASSNVARPHAAPTRCVVLVGRGVARPQRLLAGLTQRGAAARVVPDCPGVMVELARGADLVILVEPQRLAQKDELLAAMRQYYKGAACWQYDRGASGAAGEGRLSSLLTRGSAAPPRPTPASPPVRPEPVPQAVPDDMGPLLTAEELAMLMGEDDVDDELSDEYDEST